MKFLNRFASLALACVALMTICQSANAYIDPGSGSYLLQILFASVLGAAFMAKTAISNFKAAVVKRFSPHKGDDAAHVG